ncbi:UNVERIFIED_CONTAM: hypothetical protein H355_009092, partial [Colinus virginianus]
MHGFDCIGMFSSQSNYCGKFRDDTEFTEDGSLLAYTRADQGSDWSKIYFVNVKDGSLLPDVLERVKFCELTWAPDNSGIFYNTYDLKESQTTEGTEIDKHEFLKVYYHKLGTQQENDILIVHHPDEPDWMSYISTSWDQRYLILRTTKGCSPENQLWIADLNEVTEQQKDGAQAYDFSRVKWKKVVTGFEASYDYVTNDGPLFYFLSDKGAPRKHILTCDLAAADGQQAWHVHVPEGEHFLDAAKAVDGNKLVLQYIVDVTGRLHIRDLPTGTFLGEIALPHGTLDEVSCKRTFSHLLFDFTSFDIPGIIYSVSLQTLAPNKIWEPEIFYETRVRQRFWQSPAFSQSCTLPVYILAHDGERIEEILVKQYLEEHRAFVWLRCSVIVRIPHTRGFDCECVHEQTGTSRDNKTSVVEGLDLRKIAVEQLFYPGKDGQKIPLFLVHNKMVALTPNTPFLLTGYGGFNISNRPRFSVSVVIAALHFGLAYAVANIRGGGEYGKTWYEAAIKAKKQVSLDDFQEAARFLIQQGYTSAESSGLSTTLTRKRESATVVDFRAIAHGSVDRLSPLHNIPKSPRGQYPATFLVTADHDDRVAPLHSLKFIAELQ